MVSKSTAVGLLVFGVIALFLAGLMMGPIPQPQSYHIFADQRPWLGILHAWNVLSNFAFILVGLRGLFLLLTPNRVLFVDHRERWPWIGVAIGLILTSIGSGYYHLDPNNGTLVWDRLSMTVVLTSYAAALITERINVNFGLWLWPLLLIIGFYSVWSWYQSELGGNGDMRLYLGVQAFAMLTTFVMLFTQSPYDHNGYLVGILIFFALARFAEASDHQVFAATNHLFSGHTLKHFLASFTVFLMFAMLKKRKIVAIGRSQ